MSRWVSLWTATVFAVCCGASAQADHWPAPLVAQAAAPIPGGPSPLVPPPSPHRPPFGSGVGMVAVPEIGPYGPPPGGPAALPPSVVYGEFPYNCDTCGPAVYTAFKFGFGEPDDQDVTGPGIDINSDIDFGPSVGGAIGVAHRQMLYGRIRSEVEFLYRHHEVDSLDFFEIPLEPFGNWDVYSTMVNVIWDIRSADSIVYPYLGIGAGVAVHDVSVDYGTANYSGTEAEAALQLIFGVMYEWKPNLHLFVDGRYFSSRNPHFDHVARGGPPNQGPVLPGTANVESEYHAMNVTFGIMYLWGPNRSSGGLHFERHKGGFRHHH